MSSPNFSENAFPPYSGPGSFPPPRRSSVGKWFLGLMLVGFGIVTLIVEPGAFRTGLFRPGAAYESAAMPEYAETVGPTRAYVRGNDGLQPGDPAKAAQAILAALDADEPPLRLVLGADAIGTFKARLEGVSQELAAWQSVGEATAVREQ